MPQECCFATTSVQMLEHLPLATLHQNLLGHRFLCRAKFGKRTEAPRSTNYVLKLQKQRTVCSALFQRVGGRTLHAEEQEQRRNAFFLKSKRNGYHGHWDDDHVCPSMQVASAGTTSLDRCCRQVIVDAENGFRSRRNSEFNTSGFGSGHLKEYTIDSWRKNINPRSKMGIYSKSHKDMSINKGGKGKTGNRS